MQFYQWKQVSFNIFSIQVYSLGFDGWEVIIGLNKGLQQIGNKPLYKLMMTQFSDTFRWEQRKLT